MKKCRPFKSLVLVMRDLLRYAESKQFQIAQVNTCWCLGKGAKIREEKHMSIRYDTIRDAILTCARKPTRVSLIYRAEPTTKKCKNRKTIKKVKDGICSEVTVNSLFQVASHSVPVISRCALTDVGHWRSQDFSLGGPVL